MGHSRSGRRRVAEPLFELKLDLEPSGSRDASRTLYRELTTAILEGRLAAGAKLPPTRKSLAFFGVSRNTAAEVYERLVTESYAVARHGAGTFVAERIAAPLTGVSQVSEQTLKHRLNEFWLRPEVTAAMSFWRDSSEGTPAQIGRAHV